MEDQNKKVIPNSIGNPSRPHKSTKEIPDHPDCHREGMTI